MIADLHTTVTDGVLVARVEGEIDLSNADKIRAALMQEMSNALLGLVFDLTEVEYLDSAGIRVIYSLNEDLGTRGQQMRLVVPDGSVISTVLELVDISSKVGTVRNPESALAELSDGGFTAPRPERS
jgi:anti-anti-sigma factor